ncbi:hypothetical protein QZH56_09385 [Streptomyces olivoreticuli]|uniref:hypothetical protein n=1 Tax=Streptomyces olivoreticuli TaxID=68246 RepID=UPI002659FE5A|nr:hypothetical protein [Streptomyces olivoreticuli]WKK25778.1 hypothetical protein QZH56_09385 [Streptomyces olivoreticuli]
MAVAVHRHRRVRRGGPVRFNLSSGHSSAVPGPGALLPGYADHQGPAVGDFPAAEHVHATTLKLPVWHGQEGVRLADAYTAAIAKVASHAKDLL